MPTSLSRTDIVALDKRHIWHPYTAMDEYIARTDPIVVARSEGPYLFDIDGHRYLDANGQWWVSTLGHRHPRLVRALSDQLAVHAHSSMAGCTHEPGARLSRDLSALAPGANDPALAPERKLSRVFFSDNGSTAVEVAIKMAAQYWAQNGHSARTRFVTLSGAFHGETIGATSVGGLDVFRKIFGPLLFDVVHAPSPADPSGWERAFNAIEAAVTLAPDEIAAVIIEPMIQGAAGMLMHAPEFVRAVRDVTRSVDTFLIADEVFTGLGRTGATFACDHAGVVPDFLCLAKALSGGLLPFAATLASERVFDGFRGDRSRALYYGHSYCGNPLGAAVATEAVQVFHDEQIVANVQRSAPIIAERFARIAARIGNPSDARACGMVGAIDLGQGGYLANAGWRVFEAARRRGLYLRPSGDTVYIAPPLNLSSEVLTELLDGMEESILEIALDR